MEYYFRVIKHRQTINSFGKIGFVPYIEVFKTKDCDFVKNVNYKKKSKYKNIKDFEKILITKQNLQTFKFIKKKYIMPIRHERKNLICSYEIDESTYIFLY